MLQYVAVCCSVLQVYSAYLRGCLSFLHVRYRALQRGVVRVAVCCSTLQCNAVILCIPSWMPLWLACVLQYVAVQCGVRCSALQLLSVFSSLLHLLLASVYAVRCSVCMQCVAVWCSLCIKCVAVCVCSALQCGVVCVSSALQCGVVCVYSTLQCVYAVRCSVV